jgi:hypothetical protein
MLMGLLWARSVSSNDKVERTCHLLLEVLADLTPEEKRLLIAGLDPVKEAMLSAARAAGVVKGTRFQPARPVGQKVIAT